MHELGAVLERSVAMACAMGGDAVSDGKAFFVREILGMSGRAELFRFDPPIRNRGNEISFAVVSACIVDYINRPETYLFAADKDGEILSWEDLPGSQNGTIDIDAVLTEAGYEVVR